MCFLDTDADADFETGREELNWKWEEEHADLRILLRRLPYGVQLFSLGRVSKTVDELPVLEFDYVITLCGHAHESCPLSPAKTNILHVGFDDPPALAKKAKTEEKALGYYQRVRDEM